MALLCEAVQYSELCVKEDDIPFTKVRLTEGEAGQISSSLGIGGTAQTNLVSDTTITYRAVLTTGSENWDFFVERCLRISAFSSLSSRSKC